MSMRLLATRFFKNGRNILQSYWKRDIHSNIAEEKQIRLRVQKLPLISFVNEQKTIAKYSLKTANAQLETRVSHYAAGIYRFGQRARKLFVDSILKHVTTTYSAGLRSQAMKKLFYGDSAPLFALIGVSLASGAGILTKEDELECVCWEIREAASRLQNSWTYDDVIEKCTSSFSINKLIIGPTIGKGCSGVVYAAALKTGNQNNSVETETRDKNASKTTLSTETSTTKTFTLPELKQNLPNQMPHMSPIVQNFGISGDNLHLFNHNSSAVSESEGKSSNSECVTNDNEVRFHNNIHNFPSSDPQHMIFDAKNVDTQQYPLALKMIFNYDIQSNSLAILRAMYRETVPARLRSIHEVCKAWEQYVQHQISAVPAHPNIVCMYGFFCDEVGNFPDGHLLYPNAQPQRLHPDGYGRNMSLYLLMRRYDYSLREYLNLHEQQLTTRIKLFLFAQLLEAVAHISRYGIAHRDLKSDNLLIEMNCDECVPTLVLTDFGCCLADRAHGLQIPYNSFDMERGGNMALMAPEIINKKPGPFAILNYSKSDLWTCGTIAYEIFGLPNPFYYSRGNKNKLHTNVMEEETFVLKNFQYKISDLPLLPGECPLIVQQLIYNILSPNPSKRLTPVVAANVMQLFLWAPSQWLKSGSTPSSSELLQWLLSLTTKVICDTPSTTIGNLKPTILKQHLQQHRYRHRTFVEYSLICSFLCRAQLRHIRNALNWIQSVI